MYIGTFLYRNDLQEVMSRSWPGTRRQECAQGSSRAGTGAPLRHGNDKCDFKETEALNRLRNILS